jgi:thiol-disulfide isomerase/thioredoxin
MHVRTFLPAVALFTLAASPCVRAGPPATQAPAVIKAKPGDVPNAMMQAMGKAKPGEHYAITYRDAAGKALDFQTFMKQAEGGRHFLVTTDDKARVATWKLLPKGVVAVGSLSMRPPPPTLAIGSPFPAFALPMLSGRTVTEGDFKAKPYLVDFFFADCAGCIEELPVLDAYAKRHAAQPVLAVTFDDKGTTQAFVEKWHPLWPIAYAARKLDDATGVTAYPTLALVGADGKLLAMHTGPFGDSPGDVSKLEDWVRKHLAAPH